MIQEYLLDLLLYRPEEYRHHMRHLKYQQFQPPLSYLLDLPLQPDS
jgi:hypothetical protein